MKILLISDEESSYFWDYYRPEKLKDIDLIISCGDLKSEYLSFLVTMARAPLMYVYGNHDAIYSVRPPEGCDCIDGRIVRYKGLRIMGLGGSIRYSGGEHQYTEKQMKRRILRMLPQIWWNRGFDILVTHSPIRGCGDEDTYAHRGFECFRPLLDKCKPKYMFHGHVHLRYLTDRKRVQRYGDTTVINASGYYILDIPEE